jgi:hypothetical protein
MLGGAYRLDRRICHQRHIRIAERGDYCFVSFWVSPDNPGELAAGERRGLGDSSPRSWRYPASRPEREGRVGERSSFSGPLFRCQSESWLLFCAEKSLHYLIRPDQWARDHRHAAARQCLRRKLRRLRCLCVRGLSMTANSQLRAHLRDHPRPALHQLQRVLPRCRHGSEPWKGSEPPPDPGGGSRPALGTAACD